MSMEYIAAEIGEKTYYIEKIKILSIIEKPEVYEVPGADSEIAGISAYGDRLVVYFNMGKGGHSACGIVVDTEHSVLYGLTAEHIWAQEMEPELLVSVLPGVWVVRDDKTD